MRKIDFAKHNEEQKAVWQAYMERKPIRVPMTLGIFQRYTMFNYDVNVNRHTFKDFFEDPEILLEHNLQTQYYIKHNIPFDHEMGIPENGWDVMIDFQNLYEAAWFGAEIDFPQDQVPSCKPFLKDDNKRLLLDKPMPEIYTGIFGKVKYFHDYLSAKKAAGYEFHGKSFNLGGFTGIGTDGPLTVCCDMRGTTEFLTDLMCDEDYAQDMLSLVTEAAIMRIKAFRKDFPGWDFVWPVYGFTDDSIELLSVDMYKEKIMPHHKRLLAELRNGSPDVLIHICGNAQRHHKTLVEELGVSIIDTGFPMDFAGARALIGDECQIYGGPSVPFLESHSYDDVYKETERILTSGIAKSGRFVLREANNLPASVSVDNLWAMYDCVRNTKIYN